MLCALPACSTPRERKAEADRDVYGALEVRRPIVPVPVGPLDIDAAEARGRAARDASNRIDLDLEGAVRLAAEASREFRSRREDVYLTALAYTGERHRFENQYALGGTATVARDGSTGTVSGRPEASLSRNLENGASFVLKLATDFLTAFAGDPATAARTIISADLIQPLARGSSREVAREVLTQSERDVLYQMRAFARFQQEFTASVATEFLRLLQGRDTIRNEELSAKNLEIVYERAKEFGPDGVGKGRIPNFEVDQAYQNVLRARDRVILARQSYEDALDEMKLTLGLPPTTTLVPRADALEALTARGLEPLAFDLPRALGAAEANRLDLENARDQYVDAVRKVEVAADGLGPQVDLRLGGALTGPKTQPLDLKGLRGSGYVGLDVSLPVEREAERNAFRAALVQEDRARRAVEQLDDSISVSVRRTWRTLAQARSSYEIQQEGVRIASRRVESANMNLELGRAEIRDVLEAEAALVEAKNAATAALIDHAVARLDLERDTGTLRPDAWTGTHAGAAASVPPPFRAGPAPAAPSVPFAPSAPSAPPPSVPPAPSPPAASAPEPAAPAAPLPPASGSPAPK